MAHVSPYFCSVGQLGGDIRSMDVMPISLAALQRSSRLVFGRQFLQTECLILPLSRGTGSAADKRADGAAARHATVAPPAKARNAERRVIGRFIRYWPRGLPC